MDAKALVKQFLKEARVMQLATSVDNKPWVCNVHFYADDELNIYWASAPARRHSEEIAKNPNIAATIKIHEDTPEEAYVIGISIEGTAKLASEEEAKKIAKAYGEKLGKSPTLIEEILSGKNPNKFYKLTQKNVVLFDTHNFPDNPRQEFHV